MSAIDAPYDQYTGPLSPPPVKDDYHRTLGRILFSKVRIYPGREKKEEITNKFELGDRVHGTAYLPADLKTLKFGRSFGVRFINYEEQGLQSVYHPEDTQWVLEKRTDGTDPATENFFGFDMFTPIEKTEYPNMTRKLMDGVDRFIRNKFNEREDSQIYRTYKLTVTINANGKEVAQGEIFYTISRSLAIKRPHLSLRFRPI